MSETAPWLLLTLRRTGATSLAQCLARLSPNPTAAHEPFNTDRAFGEITRTMLHEWPPKPEVLGQVREDVGAILHSRQNIKHCLELVPVTLSDILISEAKDAGYRFLLLTRQDEYARLKSLMIAYTLGSWHEDQPLRLEPNGKARVTPECIEHLRKHTRRDPLVLGRCLATLRRLGVPFEWQTTEDLLNGAGEAGPAPRRLCESLGLPVAEDEAFPELAPKQRQGGNENAARIINLERSQAILHDLLVM